MIHTHIADATCPADNFIINQASDAFATLLLAHGAMAPMDSAFLEELTHLLVGRGLTVMRFEFAYMAARRRGGKRRPPPHAEKLLPEYRAAVIQALNMADVVKPLIIGGKSLGGRVASMIADELFGVGKSDGLACLGYPFHPLNKPEVLRISHLETISCPALIIQGERDPFGTKQQVKAYKLDAKLHVHWLYDCDHDYSPRVRSGVTQKDSMMAAADVLAKFAKTLSR